MGARVLHAATFAVLCIIGLRDCGCCEGHKGHLPTAHDRWLAASHAAWSRWEGLRCWSLQIFSRAVCLATVGVSDGRVGRTPVLLIPRLEAAALHRRQHDGSGGRGCVHARATRTTGAQSGDCSDQILYAAADTLVRRRFGANNRGRAWYEWVKVARPDIVVLGVGPHVYGDGNYTSVLEMVAKQALSFPAVRFIWRTTMPGGCGASPLSTTPGPPFWQVYTGQRFNWGSFATWDAIARRFWAVRNVSVLDLAPLHRRVDAHVGGAEASGGGDCLHFCDAALRLVPTVLLHLLRDGQAAPLPSRPNMSDTQAADAPTEGVVRAPASVARALPAQRASSAFTAARAAVGKRTSVGRSGGRPAAECTWANGCCRRHPTVEKCARVRERGMVTSA